MTEGGPRTLKSLIPVLTGRLAVPELLAILAAVFWVGWDIRGEIQTALTRIETNTSQIEANTKTIQETRSQLASMRDSRRDVLDRLITIEAYLRLISRSADRDEPLPLDPRNRSNR